MTRDEAQRTLTVRCSSNKDELLGTRCLRSLGDSSRKILVAALSPKNNVLPSSCDARDSCIFSVANMDADKSRNDVVTKDGRELSAVSHEDANCVTAAQGFAYEALA